MASGSARSLALAARLAVLESLIQGAADFTQGCLEGARALAAQRADPAVSLKRRDLVLDLPRALPGLQAGLRSQLQDATVRARMGQPLTAMHESRGVDVPLTLVDDLQVEQDLARSRLVQHMADATQAEAGDLRARLQSLRGQLDEADTTAGSDIAHPAWLASLLLPPWLAAGLDLSHWQTAQVVLHQEAAHWFNEALHRANQLLRDRGVRPELNLRPFIRRALEGGVPSAPQPLAGAGDQGPPTYMASGLMRSGGVHEETRLMTQTPGLQRPVASPQQVLGQLKQTVARHVPGFAATEPAGGAVHTVSAGLARALHVASGNQPGAGQVGAGVGAGGASFASGGAVAGQPTWAVPPETPEGVQVALHQLQETRQALKQAAATPAERATIEVVALMFQSILMEERLPAGIRVWFARLQMPVLRVAVSEPDFFASVTHPARVLIDRMGACVMGFVAGAQQDDDALHREIKRVVQVVEAYPETGRRVFQTVLNEFERFLDGYFREHNQASRQGVSLAQQVEQRETWAIQYTIELRKMLDHVPVHEGVRHFLFSVWADVLAHGAVRHGPASDETRVLKKAAGDLIWSASAKTSREDRAEVLRRLPPLLKALREGMAQAGLPVARQDEHIQALNTALAAAFTARSAVLSSANLAELMARLEAIDEVLPDLGEVELDDDLLRDLSGHDSDGLEVVTEGGTMATPAMLGWARELQIGAWFQLDYRGRQEPVQLAWRGLNKQLALFARPAGPAVLFQLHRLAAFLQAGLMVPLEDESLTTRATRQALARLHADPSRLQS